MQDFWCQFEGLSDPKFDHMVSCWQVGLHSQKHTMFLMIWKVSAFQLRSIIDKKAFEDRQKFRVQFVQHSQFHDVRDAGALMNVLPPRLGVQPANFAFWSIFCFNGGLHHFDSIQCHKAQLS